MAQESLFDSQDITSLTDAILPSNTYLKSWNQNHVRVSPNTPTALLKSNNTPGSVTMKYLAVTDFTGSPMRFSDAGQSHGPALGTSSRQQFVITSPSQEEEVNDMAQSLKVQGSRYAAHGLSPNITPEEKTQPAMAQDPLSALKMKARESVMAKRAQSVRSTSRDSRTVGTEVSATDSPQERGHQLAGQVGLIESQTSQADNASGHLSHMRRDKEKGCPLAAVEMVSAELDNLLAEGKAAASAGDSRKGSPNTTEAQDIVPANMAQQGTGSGLELPYPQEQLNHQPEADANHTVATNSPTFHKSEIDDIDMWLTMTGYYDKPYRNKVLSRRRRLKQIEEERLQLLEEEQADHLVRGQLYHRTEILTSQRMSRAASIVHPPSSLGKQDGGAQAKQFAQKAKATLSASKTTIDTPKKRGIEDDTTDANQHRMTKTARTESHQRSPPMSHRRSSGAIGRISACERNGVDAAAAALRPHSPSNGDISERRARDQDRGYQVPWRQSQEREQRTNGFGGRPDERHDSGASISHGLRPDRAAGNVRFFLLKSWNTENIKTAQRECTWATQTKNEELIVEAYESCRHVIFIFSANHSKAFQGYARMEGLPGERDVEPPSWVKNLHWPSTAPFRIKWIVKGEIPYRVVGNLKNPLNENLPIFVGRDGQEIPEELGDELCEIIDEEDASQHFRR